MAACVLEDDSPLLFTVFIFLPELEPVDNNLGIRPFKFGAMRESNVDADRFNLLIGFSRNFILSTFDPPPPVPVSSAQIILTH
jgi:TRAP-type mannitol/chloroaromatic compound transport system permease large subunit